MGQLTESTPIPKHLTIALPLRARRILELSCEELLAMGEQAMLRLAGCGQKLLQDLKNLQRRILVEYPDLLPHYTTQSVVVPPQTHTRVVRPRRKKPANDPTPSRGPAEWSILNRTLPDLYQLPQLPPDGDPASEATIATLGLPTADLERLRSIAVFPEDPIHLLGSLSLGYLSRAGLGYGFFSMVHTALTRLHGVPATTEPSLALALAQVRDTSL